MKIKNEVKFTTIDAIPASLFKAIEERDELKAINSQLLDALDRIANGEFEGSLPYPARLLAIRTVARKAIARAEGK